ncbi:metal ABC transporter substrate-binding protein [Rhodoplanes sp. Z2-YC6860]|uniref:metal ABC transporter substrate-binding protein n=1 Tax=Rhodoplanes sp. Z2-YC6860 TaxID=674703 RepID=UPI00078C8D7E|nr:metal ABC transporter substrate-binding protein [Rhodoplanes sp. Z2-YC6860]AMN39814.1 zinc ABC transporter periplasmic-binding protein ZnuA [Rhodoplanes sp. Z2-YC6860]
MFRRAVMLALFAALIASPAHAGDRLKAVASISIIGDLVKNVGGDRVDVATLVGPNSDAHVFSPTPTDAKTLGAAKIVFVNGMGLEGWMTRLVAVSGAKLSPVVVTTSVKPRQAEEGGHHAVDPHAWQSVANARIYIANIRDGLKTSDPANAATYDANAKAYLDKLDALEREVREAIGKIPADHRKIITTHDAFGYFGQAYGVEFIAPTGVSSDSEPSARDIAKIISQVKRQKIPAVFMENISDPRMMQQIARETGARIGGTLYSDALSGASGPAATYVDMMRNNVRELVKALTP